MLKINLVAGVALLSLCSLGGCGTKSDAPTKRQPGSWSTKVEILKFEGKDVKPNAKAGMQEYFNLMSLNALCITPEAAAQDDIGRNIENASGAGKNCQFDKRNISGGNVEFSGVCSDGAKKIRMSAKGTTGATAQDITMTIQPLGADGNPEGTMEMRMSTTRTGECKAGDITPPPTTPGTTAGGK